MRGFGQVRDRWLSSRLGGRFLDIAFCCCSGLLRAVHSFIRSFLDQWRLKYCTARSCASAFSLEENVPRLRRLPVFEFFLREYRRYCPDFSFRIMLRRML